MTKAQGPGTDGSSGNLSGMIAIGGLWLASSRVVRAASNLLAVVVLARLLSPADFGVIALVLSSTVLSLLLLEGVIDYPLSSRTDLHADTVQSVLWLGFACMGLMSVVIYLAAPHLEAAIQFPRLADSLRAVIPVYLGQVFFVAGCALLKRRKRFQDIAKVSFCSAFIYLVMAVLLALAGMGLWSVILAQVTASLVATLIVGRLAQLSISLPRRWSMAPVASTSMHGFAARSLAWIWTNFDTFAVSAHLGPAATGIYSRGYNLCVQLKEPFHALNEPLRQAFVSIQQRNGQLAGSVIQGLRLAILLSGLIASACIALREPIVLVLLGSQWQEVAPVLGLLAAGLPARVALNMLENMDLSINRLGPTLVRHVFLVVVVGFGVFAAAPHGLVAVSALVTSSIFLALLLPRRSGERSVGTLGLVAAMAPGVILGGLLAAVSEYLVRPLFANPLFGWISISGIYLLVITGLVAWLPASWLPNSVQKKRLATIQKILRRTEPTQ